MARLALWMAAYNDAAYLRRTLEALERSTFRDFQLTVVDDGSTDDTAAVAESFAGRLPLTVRRCPHRGIARTKREALGAEPLDAPYLMILDSDILVAPDTLARMLAALDSTHEAAAISPWALADEGTLWGRGLAFLERLFLETATAGRGEGVIVGGCALMRRACLRDAEVPLHVSDDIALAAELRAQGVLLCPPDLVVVHLGEPQTLRQVLRRGEREGLRVAAVHRAEAEPVRFASLVRLAPLPLVVIALGSGALGAWPLSALAGAGLGAYVGAFLLASRRVPGSLPVRLAAAGLFTWGNLGFAYGYAREWLRHSPEVLADGTR